MSITVDHLTKKFGKQAAVNNISFHINEGEIVGFLGPNGAGKSTTMRIAAGYTPPSEGTVRICDLDVREKPKAIRRLIGYLPEHNPLYYDMYVREFLQFIARLHGITGGKARARIDQMVALCGLTREQNKLIGSLSKGYRQRVGLAQALIHDPKVLILDEPTTGLDPNQIVEIRNLIRDISRDKTVLFSTHIMQEVQAICDKAVIINQGSIVAFDRLDKLQDSKADQVVIVVQLGSRIDSNSLKAFEGVSKVVEEDDFIYRIFTDQEKKVRQQLSKVILELDLELISLNVEKKSMEEIFYQLTKSGS